MAEPQHTRLAQLIEKRVKSGEYPIGARIPSERELCEIYGVSRITVRQAIAELTERGVLNRQQGRGTFVATPRIEQSLLDHFTFAEELRDKGLLVASTVLLQEVAEASTEQAAHLGLEQGAGVLHLVRQRRADGEPYAIETTYLPLEHFPGVEQADFGTRSLYEVLATDYGTRPMSARETFEPVLVRPRESQDLNVKAGSPALLLLRTTYDSTGRAVEFARALIRGDRCRMLVELRADRGTAPKVVE